MDSNDHGVSRHYRLAPWQAELTHLARDNRNVRLKLIARSMDGDQQLLPACVFTVDQHRRRDVSLILPAAINSTDLRYVRYERENDQLIIRDQHRFDSVRSLIGYLEDIIEDDYREPSCEVIPDITYSELLRMVD